MAIVRPSALVGAISGALGSSVFVQSKRGTVVRQRGRKLHKAGIHLSLTRKQQQGLSQCWQSLDAAERLSWRRVAEQMNRTSRVGEASPMTGFQAYLQFWSTSTSRLTAAGGYVPLAVRTPTELLLIAYFSASGTYAVNAVSGGATGTVPLAFYGARQFRSSPGWTPNRWMMLGGFLRADLPEDITAAFKGRLGALAVGEYYWLGMRSKMSKAMWSSMITYQGVCVA